MILTGKKPEAFGGKPGPSATLSNTNSTSTEQATNRLTPDTALKALIILIGALKDWIRTAQ